MTQFFQLQAAEVQPVPGRVRGLRKTHHRAEPGSEHHNTGGGFAGRLNHNLSKLLYPAD